MEHYEIQVHSDCTTFLCGFYDVIMTLSQLKQKPTGFDYDMIMLRGLWVRIPGTAFGFAFDSAMLHWLLFLEELEVAIGQYSCAGIMVATKAPFHGADNVIPDNEDSGEPPIPHWSNLVWASRK